MDDSYDLKCKIVFIGDSNVGKTAISERFAKGTFTGNTIPTVGVAMQCKNIHLYGKTIMVSIWDTAGLERYKSLVRSYYRETQGFIIVYHITDRTSFQNIIKWHDEIKKNAEDDVDKLIVGNKCDLKHIREVTYKEAKSLAENLGIQYMETSAKDGLNVDVILETLAASIAQRITPESTSSDDDNITLSNATNTNSQTNNGCWC